MRDTRRWVRREDVLWRETADAVLAVPPGGDHPVALTGPGVPVWHLLTVPMTGDAIVTRLTGLYRDPAARMTLDVDRLLVAMAGQHLVEQAP